MNGCVSVCGPNKVSIGPGCHCAFTQWPLGETPADPESRRKRRVKMDEWMIDGWMDGCSYLQSSSYLDSLLLCPSRNVCCTSDSWQRGGGGGQSASAARFRRDPEPQRGVCSAGLHPFLRQELPPAGLLQHHLRHLLHWHLRPRQLSQGEKWLLLVVWYLRLISVSRLRLKGLALVLESEAFLLGLNREWRLSQ